MNNSKNKLFHKINYFATLLLMLYLPFNPTYLPYVVVLFLLSFVPLIGRKVVFSREYIPHILLMTFYLLHMPGVLFSENKTSAFFDLEVKLTLFLFPLMFGFAKHELTVHTKNIRLSFVYGVVLSSLFYIISACWHSLSVENGKAIFNVHPVDEPWYNYFFYEHFSFFIQSSYYSMYLVFALFLLIEGYTYDKNRFHMKPVVLILSVMLLLAGIVFTSSRSGMLGVGLMIIFYALKHVRKRITYYVIPLVFVLFTVLVLLSSRTRQFIDSFKNDGISVTITDERIRIWYADIQLISDNFLTGVGNGDVQDELKPVYKRNNFEYSYKQRLNAHNQYFETFIGLGISGFLLLLLILVIPLIKAFKERNYILIFFLLLIFFNFLFESMLNRINGVVFFAFFYSLLTIKEKKN